MIYPNYDKYFLHNLNIFFNRAERVVQKIKSEGYVNFDIFVDTSDLN